MLEVLLSMRAAVPAFFRCRAEGSPEVLALRQQVGAQAPTTAADADASGPRLLDHPPARVAAWADLLLIVKPETVARWHRAGFRLYWRWRSRHRGGRPPITEEMQTSSAAS